MDLSITSNFTNAGTVVVIDGKTFKNVKCIDFDMYPTPEYASVNGQQDTDLVCFNVSITTKDTDADGVEKHLRHTFSKTDDGDVKDSVTDMTPTKDQLASMFADIALGKNRKHI